MRHPQTNRHAGALASIAAVMALGACGGGAPPAGSAEQAVRVVAGFYPLQFVAEQVGGDRVGVTNLAQPGAEPHDLELKPRQVAELAEADLVVYLGGFQPALDEAAEQAGAEVFDIATVIPLTITDAGGEGVAANSSTRDPHFWLDPTRLATVSDALAGRLATIDPAGASQYRHRAGALRTRLGELDQAFALGLRACRAREIVTSHDAFGYLAERYGLVQVAITGLSPEVEPTPQRLAEVAAEARRLGATTIFFETLVSARVAEAIAAEVGADTAVLDPIEGLPAGTVGDYFSVMRANLSTLMAALRCR